MKMKTGNILLVIALLVCLLPMPYGYYILVRFISTIVFGVMAYEYFQQKRKKLYVIMISLALLFQPFLKIPLGREIWNLVDVVVAIFLIYLSVRKEHS